MTISATEDPAAAAAPTAAGPAADRYRLHRAGILNVWQYDEQVFTLGQGRMLLRGANGAGKSKTLEMLLPFALDGDKSRLTASARHHTSLLWLMTDGYEGQTRVGYVWVEFLRSSPDGSTEAFTCGVGIRASASAKTATAWHFATTRRIGIELRLEDDAGPLSAGRLEEALGADGQVFPTAAAFKEHVGRTLFGLGPAQYDEVLRLLYWLRMPQIGEDIEPAKLAQQLAQALPQLDEQAVRSAGETFDELTAFGEQIERRIAAAAALEQLADAYTGYARAVVAERAAAVQDAVRTERRLRTALRRADEAVAELSADLDKAREAVQRARDSADTDDARISELEASDEANAQRRLAEIGERAEQDEADAARAADRVSRRASAFTGRADTIDGEAARLDEEVTQHSATLRDLDRRQREAVPGSGVAAPARDETPLAAPEQAAPLIEWLAVGRHAVEEARVGVSHRRAAVTAVGDALHEADEAAQAQKQADAEAERAEGRWEEARASADAAGVEVDEALAELARDLGTWAGSDGAAPVELPVDLVDAAVAGLPELARAAAAPPLAELRAGQQSAMTRRDTAQAEIDELTAERESTIAEPDPVPPRPVLVRTPRPDGAPLWRLVDFADHLDEVARAGIEAALQDAGLLDAWLRPDGRLLDAEHRDVALAPGGQPAGRTLVELLQPDIPAGSDVTADAVSRVLDGIGVEGDAPARIAPDGSWRLGPAHGRAAKERAQYIGATARAEERRRRIADLEARIEAQRRIVESAAAEIADLTARIAVLEEWVAAVPTGSALQRARIQLAEREAALAREADANRAAQQAAHGARAAAGRARDELDRLARSHELPNDREALAAVSQRLTALEGDLRRTGDAVGPLQRDVRRWEQESRRLADDLRVLEAERAEAAAAEQRAQLARASHEELLASVGAAVRELDSRLGELRASRDAHRRAADDAVASIEELRQRYGAAEKDVAHAREGLTEHAGTRAAALEGLGALAAPPGLLAAAAVGDDDAAVIAAAAGTDPDEPVPTTVRGIAERLAAHGPETTASAVTAVWRAYTPATSGPAADHQPVIAEFGELIAVTGRDDAGEAPIVPLASRVRAAIDRDRELLTEREKQQFERHVLGELGDAIRRCRLEAEELVQAMNNLLGEVSTSQGIRVRLDWRLREDVPPEAREAVRLLGQPVGALLPEERTALRDVLHRLIEASRAERPELSYSEHLAAALDYRTWSEFTIRYNRPEKPGVWDRLHRRSPLSQGEQKVLCYLPLFAAAAAHFTSLAGAAPHAPRLVLLDDAFPKIDVRTHPLLFGLLVQLDLDFVITSERLWGDHDTVPSLAIYEALRDPAQRGIAQYEYRWDGRALRAVG